MLELARQQAEVEEQLSLAHAERDRNASALARAQLAREQLTTAQEALRQKEEQLASTSAERRSLQSQIPSLTEARTQLLAKLGVTISELKEAGAQAREELARSRSMQKLRPLTASDAPEPAMASSSSSPTLRPPEPEAM